MLMMGTMSITEMLKPQAAPKLNAAASTWAEKSPRSHDFSAPWHLLLWLEDIVSTTSTDKSDFPSTGDRREKQPTSFVVAEFTAFVDI